MNQKVVGELDFQNSQQRFCSLFDMRRSSIRVSRKLQGNITIWANLRTRKQFFLIQFRRLVKINNNFKKKYSGQVLMAKKIYKLWLVNDRSSALKAVNGIKNHFIQSRESAWGMERDGGSIFSSCSISTCCKEKEIQRASVSTSVPLELISVQRDLEPRLWHACDLAPPLLQMCRCAGCSSEPPLR